MPVIRLAMAQMNAVVGGFAQNVETLGRFRTQAASMGADLVLTPELSLMGYPPEDLLLKNGFIEASRRSTRKTFMAAASSLLASTNIAWLSGVKPIT